jgi:fermentation-respiration switch protein FrsA (DUF1100 family)
MAVHLYGSLAAVALSAHYDSLSSIRRVHCPVLVMHGGADQLIPPSMGRALFAAAHQPKQLWIVDGADHNDLRWRGRDDYARRLADFLHFCSLR